MESVYRFKSYELNIFTRIIERPFLIERPMFAHEMKMEIAIFNILDGILEIACEVLQVDYCCITAQLEFIPFSKPKKSLASSEKPIVNRQRSLMYFTDERGKEIAKMLEALPEEKLLDELSLKELNTFVDFQKKYTPENFEDKKEQLKYFYSRLRWFFMEAAYTKKRIFIEVR